MQNIWGVSGVHSHYQAKFCNDASCGVSGSHGADDLVDRRMKKTVRFFQRQAITTSAESVVDIIWSGLAWLEYCYTSRAKPSTSSTGLVSDGLGGVGKPKEKMLSERIYQTLAFISPQEKKPNILCAMHLSAFLLRNTNALSTLSQLSASDTLIWQIYFTLLIDEKPLFNYLKLLLFF